MMPMKELKKQQKTSNINHTLGWWKKHLDPLMSKLVREKGICDRCGSTNIKFDWSHVVSRINLTLRWDIINSMCLCFRCHRFFWHEEPLQSAEWFKQKYPGRYEYLLKVKNLIIKRTEQDYIELREAIKNKDTSKLHYPLERLNIIP